MDSNAPWFEEIALVAGLFFLMLLVGYAGDLGSWPAVSVIAGWLGWHLYNLQRLLRGIGHEKAPLPGGTPGLWGYVYYRIQLQKKTNQARKKQIQRLLKEFSNSAKALPDATIVLNEYFEIQWSNKAARTLLALKKADAGHTITDLVRDPALRKWLHGDAAEQPLLLTSPADGVSSLQLQFVAYGQGQSLLIARDITESKRLDQMRRDFIANASHELRTPLTVLQGSLDAIELRSTDDEALAKPLAWMRRQSDRMQRILEDLLTLARLEDRAGNTEEWAEVAVADIVQAACKDAALLSDSLGGHHIELDIDADLMVLGEADSLSAAIGNLVINAVRYTPAGGSISVRWHKTAAGARFMVTDTGPGIPQRHLSRLTERFYRTDIGRSRETGGTGLGLAIVKHVLDQYSIRLQISSQTGQGSTFAFTIPAKYFTDADEARGTLAS